MAGRNPIDVTFQDESLTAIRKKLGDMEKRAPSVMSNALNKAQTIMKKYLPEQVKETYSYKRKLQKPRQQRASRKKLTATLFYDRKDPGIENFNFTPGTAGVPRNLQGEKLAARIRSDGGFHNISRAFVIKTGAKEIIMRRDGPAHTPISRRFGPSEHSMIHHVWEERKSQKHAEQTLSEKLDEQINNQYLKKWGLK